MGICWAAGCWNTERVIKEREQLVWRAVVLARKLTVKRCPAPLLPSLVEVAAGAHEAADHGGNDDHKEEDGGGDAS